MCASTATTVAVPRARGKPQLQSRCGQRHPPSLGRFLSIPEPTSTGRAPHSCSTPSSLAGPTAWAIVGRLRWTAISRRHGDFRRSDSGIHDRRESGSHPASPPARGGTSTRVGPEGARSITLWHPRVNALSPGRTRLIVPVTGEAHSDTSARPPIPTVFNSSGRLPSSASGSRFNAPSPRSRHVSSRP
jgi:hypothetical protein